METFKYVVLSNEGAKVNGVIEAYNEMDAATRLRQSYDIIVKITKVDEEKTSIWNKEIGGNKLNAKAFTMMCSQFSIILSSGVPIARSVHLISEKTSNKPLKKILEKVASDVESGRSLSASFAERGKNLFPPTFVETIYSGEQSGSLDKAFGTMYQHFDKQEKMRAKVRSALTYPAFVLLVSIVVVIVLMVKVVPAFTQIFDSYGQQLPWMTRALIGISNFFSKYYIYILLIALIAYLIYKIYERTEEGKIEIGKFQLSIPVLGNIASLNAASQFSNNMAILLSSGLPLNQAISITARTLDNYYVGNEVGKMAEKIEQGISFGSCMQETDSLPDILSAMVGVGEESGELESTLSVISSYYDEELRMAIESALKKLEPTILIVIALVAGFIVISVYMAMFSMYAAM